MRHNIHIFEINPVTGTCVAATHENTKVLRKEKHCYIPALNRKDALTKFFKIVSEQLKEINAH